MSGFTDILFQTKPNFLNTDFNCTNILAGSLKLNVVQMKLTAKLTVWTKSLSGGLNKHWTWPSTHKVSRVEIMLKLKNPILDIYLDFIATLLH